MFLLFSSPYTKKRTVQYPQIPRRMRSMKPSMWIPANALGSSTTSSLPTPWCAVRGRNINYSVNRTLGYILRDNGTTGWGRHTSAYWIRSSSEVPATGWFPDTDVPFTWLITDAYIDPSADNNYGYWGIGGPTSWDLQMSSGRNWNPLVKLGGSSSGRPWSGQTMYNVGEYIDFALVNLTGGNYLIAVRAPNWNGGVIDILPLATNSWSRTPGSHDVLFAWTDTLNYGFNGSIGETTILESALTRSQLEQWGNDPYNFWYVPEPIPIWVSGEPQPPGEDHTVNLPVVELSVDAPPPGVTAELTETVNVPAPQLDTDSQAPEIDVPILLQVFLDRSVELDIDPQAPDTVAKEDITVNLLHLDVFTGTLAPQIEVGGEQIITLEAAVELDVDPIAPTVFAELTHEINVPAALLDVEPAVGNVEGVSELPPSIDVPTDDQIYTFGLSGTLPAPPHSIGTGDNPTWSLPIDNFGIQPGVMTWSINPTTGDITYQINQLSGDPDEQALNTKGPYSVTRRITTTEGNADESFDVMVNVGNYTLQMTPGTKPCYTWTTKTAAARGLEPTKDPSARVTQTYTVT